MLAAVTCFYNPCNYHNIRRNYTLFREYLPPDLPLFTAELSFTGEFTIPAALHLQGSEQNLMWQKERLLNILIERLPPEYDMVAWLDADLIFLNDDWVSETIQKLQRYPVVQLFERVTDLDAEFHELRTKIGNPYGRAMGINDWKRPGGAWAARRDILQHGLADEHILGGSDAMMLAAWQGKWEHPLMKRLTPSWKEYHLRYAARVYPLVRDNIGWVSGDCLHLYHGSTVHRNYVGRWKYLSEYDFDPSEDITLDDNGLWKWSSDKPEMHEKVAGYFAERREDQ